MVFSFQDTHCIRQSAPPRSIVPLCLLYYHTPPRKSIVF
nr:MAG TPA: hypothetical protein [Caudoviricetes sp.]